MTNLNISEQTETIMFYRRVCTAFNCVLPQIVVNFVPIHQA